MVTKINEKKNTRQSGISTEQLDITTRNSFEHLLDDIGPVMLLKKHNVKADVKTTDGFSTQILKQSEDAVSSN